MAAKHFSLEGAPYAGKTTIRKSLAERFELEQFPDPAEYIDPDVRNEWINPTAIDLEVSRRRVDIWVAAAKRQSELIREGLERGSVISDRTVLLNAAVFLATERLIPGLVDVEYGRSSTRDAIASGAIAVPDVLFVLQAENEASHIRRVEERRRVRQALPDPLNEWVFAEALGTATLEVARELMPNTDVIPVISYDDRLVPEGPTLAQVVPVVEQHLAA